jgi:hypothetical protein
LPHVMMVQDLSNGFRRTHALEIWCSSYGIHDKYQCLVKHICTKFLCVPLSLRTFVQINSLTNVGTLCLVTFQTVWRLQSVLHFVGWGKYECTLVVDVRQTEIHTVEPQGPEQSAFEFEMVNEKLNRPKWPAIVHMSAEFIRTAVEELAHIH